MKFKPISLAPKAPDDLTASPLLSSIFHISPTGTLCSREVELLSVFQTCMLLHVFVPSFSCITSLSPHQSPTKGALLSSLSRLGGKKSVKNLRNIRSHSH